MLFKSLSALVLSAVSVVYSQQSIDGLHVQIDQFESEIEGIVSKKKKLDREVSVGLLHSVSCIETAPSLIIAWNASCILVCQIIHIENAHYTP